MTGRNPYEVLREQFSWKENESKLTAHAKLFIVLQIEHKVIKTNI